MNDQDVAQQLVKAVVELAPYAPVVKAMAQSTAAEHLKRDPTLASRLVEAARRAMFPCGHANAGCPTCAKDRPASGAQMPAPTAHPRDAKEVGDATVARLRNAN